MNRCTAICHPRSSAARPQDGHYGVDAAAMSAEPIETETLIEAFQDNAAPSSPQHGAVVPGDDLMVVAYHDESAPTTPKDKPADPAKKPGAPAKKAPSPARARTAVVLPDARFTEAPAKKASAPAAKKEMPATPMVGTSLANHFGMPYLPLQMVCSAIKTGSPKEMLTIGRKARLIAGEGSVIFIPPELYALGWAANTFANRVETVNDAEAIDVAQIFAIPPKEVYSYGCFGRRKVQVFPIMVPETRVRMTNASSDRAILALRDALRRGNGETLLAFGKRVEEEWAIGYRNVPDLHALVWSCHILGERCLKGDFGSSMTPEEAAFLARLESIVQRVHNLETGEEQVALARWHAQVTQALADMEASPASDGLPEAFVSRTHLRALPALAAVLNMDDEGCAKIATVEAMPLTSEKIMALLDTDHSKMLDEEELRASKLDLEPIFILEACLRHAEKQAKAGNPPGSLACRFVADGAILLEQRKIERDLIEGVIEANGPTLIAALAELEAKPKLAQRVAPELVPPARQTIVRLQVEEELDVGVQERVRAKCVAALERVGKGDAGKWVSRELLEGARAMIEKLDLFTECAKAVDAADADGLKAKIHDVMSGWWMDSNHASDADDGEIQSTNWLLADKNQLHLYKVALKVLTVLSSIRKYMEPLNAAQLQASVDVALEVQINDPLVDKAIEILNALDRETRYGEFAHPLSAGGPYEGDSWLANPQFCLTFPAEVESHTCKLSIIMIEGGDNSDVQFFEDFGLHLIQNPAGSLAEEVAPDHKVVAKTEYDSETSILVLEALPTGDGARYYIVPSTKLAREVGPFKINFLCETPGVNMNVEAVVKTGDLVLEAMRKDDLVELERLLNFAKERKIQRVHAKKALLYLARRKKEMKLNKACEDADADHSGEVELSELKGLKGGIVDLVAAFQDGLADAASLNVPPSLVEKSKAYLAQLLALPPLVKASEDKDWQALDAAIHAAREGHLPERTIEPYMKEMLLLRSAARLRACLARGEDGFPELQSCYDAALATELKGADVDEAKRILDALKDAQRSFHGAFDQTSGGAKTNALWVDNPQYKLTIGTPPPQTVSVSLDRDGAAEYVDYAVHVVSVPAGGDQVGEACEVVMESAYNAETKTLKFAVTAEATYFIVCSAKEAHMAGGFVLTTIGVGKYTLEEVSLLQIEIKAAMNAKSFEDLPKLIARGVCEKANIPSHPELVKAKLIGNIEKGWQEKDAEFMGSALGTAKKAKVDKVVLKTYLMRYKQLSMQGRLHKALENKDTAFLLAGVEMANLIEYTGTHWNEAQAITKKHTFHKSIASIFLDENAAGARKFGSWRDNPAWKLTATAKTMVYIAINEDGKLDEATEVRLQKKQRKSDLKFAAARDKVASTQAASDAEEKNEELKAAAMDAMRVFTEMDQRRRIKKQKIDDGDEDAFTQVGVHVVKNTRLSAFPGVTAGYVDIASCNEYGDDQAWLSFEYDPEMGPLFVVASTFTPGEEGIFTMSFMADAELTLEEVPDFEGNSYRFKGVWSTANQGPRSKKNGDKETGAKFAPEKTWNKNPQYRVWLKDPDTGAALDSATLSIVLSTPIEGAEMGLHIMRNAFCRTPPALEPAAVGALARLASTHIRPPSSPPPLGPGTPCACTRLHMPGLHMPCARLPTAHPNATLDARLSQSFIMRRSRFWRIVIKRWWARPTCTWASPTVWRRRSRLTKLSTPNLRLRRMAARRASPSLSSRRSWTRRWRDPL